MVASLVEEFTLNAPTIHESTIEMDYREKQIDVSGDRNRVFFDQTGHFMLQGPNSHSFSRSAETPPSSMCSRRISRIAVYSLQKGGLGCFATW